MSNYDDNMRGVLFAETRKKSENAPDYRGKLEIDGRKLEIAGWKRTSKNGTVFLSLKVEDERQRDGFGGGSDRSQERNNAYGPGPSSGGDLDLDSEIPF